MPRSTRRAIGMTTHGSTGPNTPPSQIANRMYQGRKRGMLLGDPLQVVAGDEEVLRARDAVDEADREVEPVGVFQHAGQPLGRGILREASRHLRPRRCALGEPACDQLDRLCAIVAGRASTPSV